MSSKYRGPGERLSLYQAVIDECPELEMKGATMPYTSRNGHMHSFLDNTGTVGLRLPDDARRRFIDEFDTRIAEQYGREMKEFVVVPSALLERTEELAEWFRLGHEWIGTLRPKPTKRS